MLSIDEYHAMRKELNSEQETIAKEIIKKKNKYTKTEREGFSMVYVLHKF